MRIFCDHPKIKKPVELFECLKCSYRKDAVCPWQANARSIRELVKDPFKSESHPLQKIDLSKKEPPKKEDAIKALEERVDKHIERDPVFRERLWRCLVYLSDLTRSYPLIGKRERAYRAREGRKKQRLRRAVARPGGKRQGKLIIKMNPLRPKDKKMLEGFERSAREARHFLQILEEEGFITETGEAFETILERGLEDLKNGGASFALLGRAAMRARTLLALHNATRTLERSLLNALSQTFGLKRKNPIPPLPPPWKIQTKKAGRLAYNKAIRAIFNLIRQNTETPDQIIYSWMSKVFAEKGVKTIRGGLHTPESIRYACKKTKN